ncbi:hypothetical protein [Paraburkholderia sp. J8-2]|uniref:hypothetical protein n=1 Tax=Paraburkholderia sp. J8-2 TaxID=2805440 RepID=UPI002AB684D6|nr:hypothetical protein [Paraburkholderia sp. J8-2]
MNSNLQQIIPSVSCAHVMPSAMTSTPEWLGGFEAQYREILRSEYLTELDEALARKLRMSQPAREAFEEDLWWDIVDDLKSHLGAKAANSSFEERDDQENAIVEAETWVEENVSSGPHRKILACALYLYGFIETSVRLGLAR